MRACDGLGNWRGICEDRSQFNTVHSSSGLKQHHNCSTTLSNRVVHIPNSCVCCMLSLWFSSSLNNFSNLPVQHHCYYPSLLLDIWDIFETFIYKQHTGLLGRCPQCQLDQRVHHCLLLHLFISISIFYCKQSASLSMCRLTYNLNRARRIYRTPRVRRNISLMVTIQEVLRHTPFPVQLTAVSSRSLCSVYTFAPSIKRQSFSCDFAVDHLRSGSSQGHDLPTFSLQPSMARVWLESAMACYGLTGLTRLDIQSVKGLHLADLAIQDARANRGQDAIRLTKMQPGHPVKHSETTLRYIKHHYI